MFNAVPGGWMRRAWFGNPRARTEAILIYHFHIGRNTTESGMNLRIMGITGGGGNPTYPTAKISRFAIPIILVSLWGRRTIEDVTVRFAEPTPILSHTITGKSRLHFECITHYTNIFLKAWTYLIAHPCFRADQTRSRDNHPPHICMQTLTVDYQIPPAEGY